MDTIYDIFANRYEYYLFASIKRLDTHVYFDLHELIEPCRSGPAKKRMIKRDIVLPLEVFLYFRLCGLLNERTIERSENCTWIPKNFDRLVSPSDYYIMHLSKTRIRKWHEHNYTFVFLVHAIDGEFVSTTLRTQGSWNYEIKGLKFSKPLFEKVAFKLNAVVNYATTWSEMEFRVQKLSFCIKNRPLFKNYCASVSNCFDVLLNSPTRITFENIFKILAPTVEGILKDYVIFNRIKGVNTKNLGTIADTLPVHSGFSRGFIETLKLVLKPIRDFTLHGNVPSERVSGFVVLMVLDLFEEIAERA